ncbi:MAG: cobalamin-dependent protein, partial [Candidatus Bathyarchaeota archaeon]
MREALATARASKEACPNATIILGGAHITFLPEQTMRETKTVDVGCIGEGEETIIDIVQTLSKGEDLGKVKGIIYRKNGNLVITHPRSLIEDLDSLPFPARHLLPM